VTHRTTVDRVPWPTTALPPPLSNLSVLELLEVQLIGWVKADAYLMSLIDGRIYTNVPANTPFPLVRVEMAVARPFDRMRGFGYEVTIQVRSSSQLRGDYECHRINDRIRMVVDTQQVPLPPYRQAQWRFDPGGPVFVDELAGVPTFHRPDIYRVWVTV
jgi:hypothetical protein